MILNQRLLAADQNREKNVLVSIMCIFIMGFLLFLPFKLLLMIYVMRIFKPKINACMCWRDCVYSFVCIQMQQWHMVQNWIFFVESSINGIFSIAIFFVCVCFFVLLHCCIYFIFLNKLL